jgi:hypothetical protein
VTQQFNVTREVQQQIAQTMLQARASLRKAEEAVEALIPLAVTGEMKDTLSTIAYDCGAAAGHCKRIYDKVAGPAFTPDDAKETT